MHSPSAHRALRPGQKLFANESNFRLAYTGIINQIRLTINHSGLFYTLKTVKSSCKVKHFVNFANFSVDFGLFLLRFFTVCQFFCSLPCPAQKAKASKINHNQKHTAQYHSNIKTKFFILIYTLYLLHDQKIIAAKIHTKQQHKHCTYILNIWTVACHTIIFYTKSTSSGCSKCCTYSL